MSEAAIAARPELHRGRLLAAIATALLLWPFVFATGRGLHPGLILGIGTMALSALYLGSRGALMHLAFGSCVGIILPAVESGRISWHMLLDPPGMLGYPAAFLLLLRSRSLRTWCDQRWNSCCRRWRWLDWLT